MIDLHGRVVHGSFFHAPMRGEIEMLQDALIAIDADGMITAVVSPGDPRFSAMMAGAMADDRLFTLPQHSYLLPGFVDLHVHAPQYPQLGQALDVPLEEWLQKYTFPLEARYADLPFAKQSYETLVADLLASGTTTALYFATIHQDATRVLVDVCLAKGQRALVGKVVMDDPDSCPDYYRDASVEEALEGTRQFIDYVRANPHNTHGRVQPVVTPRFIPSCTDAVLEGLGRIASQCGCHVQTHCSESDWAHGFGLDRFGRTDTASLDGFGLLTRRTVLAHSNFITDDDMGLIAERGAAVAHCARSNAYFAGSVFPLRAALEKGVRVGLGTDISGGPSASMFDSARMAVAASRMLESGVDPALPMKERGRPNSRVDFATVFHLATAGGADVLELPVGRFEPGYRFDAMLIDTQAPQGSIRFADPGHPADLLQKIIMTAARPNIAEVWVDGRSVAHNRG
jgi:guanine deaminase